MHRRALLGGLLALPGCTIVAPFDDAALAPVLRGEQAAVLLRFIVIDAQGRAIPPFAHAVGDDDLGLAIGDFDSGGAPIRRAAARFPSEAARAEGAVILFLPPGYHYLAIQGARRTDAFSYEAAFRTLPRWRIAVPAGVPLLYAGSVRLRAPRIGLLLGESVIGRIEQDATVVEEDAAWARAVAARDMPRLGPPLTRLAVRQTGPVLLGTPQR